MKNTYLETCFIISCCKLCSYLLNKPWNGLNVDANQINMLKKFMVNSIFFFKLLPIQINNFSLQTQSIP